jgi:hypothetical protein
METYNWNADIAPQNATQVVDHVGNGCVEVSVVGNSVCGALFMLVIFLRGDCLLEKIYNWEAEITLEQVKTVDSVAQFEVIGDTL